MTEHQTDHATFVVERDLPGSTREAFQFWSDPVLKERWTGCHADWTVLEARFDFREGGSEAKRWRTPEGEELTFSATYLDIVPGERLIYSYEMSFAEKRLSASLVTIELSATPTGARVKMTEQVVFLTGDGVRSQRIAGTEDGFDRLVAVAAENAALTQ